MKYEIRVVMSRNVGRNLYLVEMEVASYPAGEKEDVIVVNPASAPVSKWSRESSDKQYLYDKVDIILKETAQYIGQLAKQFKVIESNIHTIEAKYNPTLAIIRACKEGQ